MAAFNNSYILLRDRAEGGCIVSLRGLSLGRTLRLTQFRVYLFETIEQLVRYEHTHYNQ